MTLQELGIDRAAIRSFLGGLFDGALAGSLVELRFRSGGGMGQYFREVGQLGRVEAKVAQLARTTDVFVGVVPRRRRGGGRADVVEEAAVAWADCDGAEAVGALRRFRPRPSMVVASGSGCNRHAYWFLGEPVEIGELERANKRLAVALGADLASTDAARILRPAGSLAFKAGPPVPVGLLLLDLCRRLSLAELVGGLPEPLTEPSPVRRVLAPRAGGGDPLLAISPREYVELLTGQRPDRAGKIRCPFHEDDEPSLHVFAEPERGWFCFGCRRGGSVYDFAALLWGREPRGREFLALRRELEAALRAPRPPNRVPG